MHPVEDNKRLAEVHQDKPGGETEELLPEAILKLRVDSERRDDPQLQPEGTRVSAEVAEERCVLLNTLRYHDVAEDEEGTDLFNSCFRPRPFPILLLGNRCCIGLQEGSVRVPLLFSFSCLVLWQM